MSLRDNIEFMKQGPNYEEESPNEDTTGSQPKSETKVDTSYKETIIKKDDSSSSKDSSFKPDTLKLALVGIGVVAVLIGGYFIFKYATQDRGADFLNEVDSSQPAFKYSMEERAMLRNNGFTADDIERLEIEERDPYGAAKEAEDARKKKYEEEVAPYMDGASEEFKKLKEMTWIGGTPMSQEPLNPEAVSEPWYGTYNCDYIKLPAQGVQLFLKLELTEFNTSVFMTVTPERYAKLPESGNIVVTVDYNKYSDGSIVVTNVYEKDINT